MLNKSKQPNKNASKVNKSEKALSEFVVTGSNPAITFEFLKETFNKMSLLILLFVKRNIIFTVATRFNAAVLPLARICSLNLSESNHNRHQR